MTTRVSPLAAASHSRDGGREQAIHPRESGWPGTTAQSASALRYESYVGLFLFLRPLKHSIASGLANPTLHV